jgi:hypothetical protein
MPTMPHVLAGVLAAISLAVSLHFARRQRALGHELRSLRQQLRDLAGRLASAEKDAEEAASRAEAAVSVLLEKGLANEEDLEAARCRFDAPEDQQPARGSRTLH